MDINYINEAFEFYKIDPKYKQRVMDCLNEVLQNKALEQKVKEIYNILYVKNTDEYKNMWSIKDVNELFIEQVNPFITNLIVILGYNIHKLNIEKYELDKEQILIHKKRVRECFCNDLELRGYSGIRVSQMLWATYFVNMRLLEIGILQFENAGDGIVKIHIPVLPKLEMEKVKKSINNSKEDIKKYFNITNAKYICESWLLSKEVQELIPKEFNISKFYNLFDVETGENCIDDILNFVYNTKICDDYNKLAENTALQRIIKKALLDGKEFRSGIGALR